MDLAYKFWKEYEENFFNREKKLLVIVKRFNEMYKIENESLRKEVLTMALRSYFDDIFEYNSCCNEDNRNEKSKKHN